MCGFRQEYKNSKYVKKGRVGCVAAKRKRKRTKSTTTTRRCGGGTDVRNLGVSLGGFISSSRSGPLGLRSEHAEESFTRQEAGDSTRRKFLCLFAYFSFWIN